MVHSPGCREPNRTAITKRQLETPIGIGETPMNGKPSDGKDRRDLYWVPLRDNQVLNAPRTGVNEWLLDPDRDLISSPERDRVVNAAPDDQLINKWQQPPIHAGLVLDGGNHHGPGQAGHGPRYSCEMCVSQGGPGFPNTSTGWPAGGAELKTRT